MKNKIRVPHMLKRCALISTACFLLVTVTGPVPLVTQGTYLHAEVVDTVNAVTAPVSTVANAGGIVEEADQLIKKYFRRLDSYLKQRKYRQAKNELKKIYLIDPLNSKAKEYEELIDRSLQDELKKDEVVKAQKDELREAEENIRSEYDIERAKRKLKDRWSDDAWSEDGEFLHPGEVDVDEFERLQELGVDKYKKEVIREAERFMIEERYDKAARKYRDILAIDPGDQVVRELLNRAKKKEEEGLDELFRGKEETEDIEFMQEVTNNALGIEDYRKGMQGHGYAKPHVGPKAKQVPAIFEKMQIPITADFRDVDLVSVVNFLSDYTGINIITSQIVTSESRPITVRFKELPLERALKYIIKGQGLRFRVDDDLIYIATVEEMDGEELETRIYYLQKGSGVFTTFASSNMGLLGSSGGSASVSDRKSIKDLIEEAVSFPPGAKVVFDDRTGALIITNTPTNLQKIEEILYTIDESPQQILIESRFIDINMEEYDNLGFFVDANLGHWNLDQNNDLNIDPSYAFTTMGDPPGIDTSTGGVLFDFSGKISRYDYNIFLKALKRMDKSKTLSAPKITTINNQTATIKVVTEEVFPTRFEVSLIQQDLNGDGDLDDAGETEFANVPQEFVSRDIGIILQVTPSVGVDRETITLSIVPEVSQVAAQAATFPIASGFDSSGNVTDRASSGTPDLPRFTTSTLSTTVVLQSGEVAVLGGLMKESRSQAEEKIPVLGDIPFIGALFRSNTDYVDRTNLVIFITAKVIK